MNLHQLLPEKIISKAPHAVTWLVQAVFAAALPEIYEKMPQHLLTVYLGLTPENLHRLRYFTPALIATTAWYIKHAYARFTAGTSYRQNGWDCSPCH